MRLATRPKVLAPVESRTSWRKTFSDWHSTPSLWREIYARTLSGLVVALTLFALGVISGALPARTWTVMAFGAFLLATAGELGIIYYVAKDLGINTAKHAQNHAKAPATVRGKISEVRFYIGLVFYELGDLMTRGLKPRYFLGATAIGVWGFGVYGLLRWYLYCLHHYA